MFDNDKSNIKEQFERDGYIVINNVLSDDDFVELEREYAELLKEKTKKWKDTGTLSRTYEVNDFRKQLLDVCNDDKFSSQNLQELDITLPHMPFSYITNDSSLHTGPAVFNLIRNNKILDIIEMLLGSEINSTPNQHVRIKLPNKKDNNTKKFTAKRGETMYAPTMWHQDIQTQIASSDNTQVVTCWIPMHDTDETDGCLCVVPGGHKNYDILPWPMETAITDELSNKSISLPVKRGDIVLLDRRVPHSALPNYSDSIRWSFDLRFYPSGQASDRPWFPNFCVRSKQNPKQVLNNPTIWSNMWEESKNFHASSGSPLPGRREFAMLVAKSLIDKWDNEFISGGKSERAVVAGY